MEVLNSHWHFKWIEIIAGAIGGLVSYIWKHQRIDLPSRRGRVIDLNFLVSPLLGAFVAFIVDTHPVMCALLGFSANDVLRALEVYVRRRLRQDNGEHPEIRQMNNHTRTMK